MRKDPKEKDSLNEGKERRFMDIDRMVNEGLSRGNVTRESGLIKETTTDTMDQTE